MSRSVSNSKCSVVPGLYHASASASSLDALACPGRASRLTRPWAAASAGSGRCVACSRPPAPRASSAPHRRSIAISASFCYNFRVPRRMSFLLLVFCTTPLSQKTVRFGTFFFRCAPSVSTLGNRAMHLTLCALKKWVNFSIFPIDLEGPI